MVFSYPVIWNGSDSYEYHAASQCRAYSAPYVGDKRSDPVFGNDIFGFMTGDDCRDACNGNVDFYGRQCVAYERLGTNMVRPKGSSPCRLAWACDYMTLTDWFYTYKKTGKIEALQMRLF